MGWFFKKEKKDEALLEFTFIWYKEMRHGNKIHFTQPFRTKVYAKTEEEAAEKLKNFALSKMMLVIVREEEFANSDLMKLQREYDDLNKRFQEHIERIEKQFGKI